MVEMKLFLPTGQMKTHIECDKSNDIPINIPSFQYVPVNRSVLCNSKFEAENHFLFKSLAVCAEPSSKLK